MRRTGNTVIVAMLVALSAGAAFSTRVLPALRGVRVEASIADRPIQVPADGYVS